MAITAEQRLARRFVVGSSDAPAIARVDPYRGPLAVYLEKVFDVQDIKHNEAIARGNRYERPLLDWAQEQLGVEIERDVLVRHPTDLICAANLDGRVKGRRQGVEAKFTSLGGAFGDPGTDQVPDHVIVQAHHQMYVDDLELVWVPVLLARYDRPAEEMYRVDRNEDLISLVAAENRRFWEEHVIARMPPPADGPACLEIIKRIQRVAGEIVPIDPALVESWEAAKARKKFAEGEEEAAKSAMLAALGGAEIGDFGGPKWLTYYETKRAGYEVKPTTFRTPRISKKGF